MNIKHLAIVLITIVFSLPLSANQCVSVNGKLMLFYANGMINTFYDADKSLAYSYIDLLRQGNAQNLDIEYQVLENTSEVKEGSVTAEMLEVTAQYLGYQTDFQVNRLRNWYRNKLTDLTAEEDSKFIEILDRFYSTVSYDRDLERHLLQYESAFNSGYKVMTIAHSQGNLYTEKAYKSYLRNNYIHGEDYTILSVGTPIVLPEKEMMLRDVKDPVALLSDDFPTPGDSIKIDNKSVPEVVTNGEIIPSTLMPYHSYLTYLYGSDSREMIQNYFSSSIEKLFGGLGGDAVRITPDKGGNSNLDLGVYEASVFGGIPRFAASSADPQGDLFGPRGSITTSGGKDIYTIKCSDMPPSDILINGGVWNSGSTYGDSVITVSTVDGQTSVGRTRTIEPSQDSSYSGSEGVMIEYSDDGTYKFIH